MNPKFRRFKPLTKWGFCRNYSIAALYYTCCRIIDFAFHHPLTYKDICIMAKLTDKKQKAKSLYLTGQYDQKEIAGIIGVTEKTISRWKNDEEWESFKESLLTTRENELKRLYKMLKVLNNHLDKMAQENVPINSKEADSVLKLTAAIKNLELETSIADKVEVGTAFIDFVRKENLDLSKEITTWFDMFLKRYVK